MLNYEAENDREYARLAADAEWVAINRGRFVAIAVGSLIGIFDSRDEFLASTEKSHPDTSVLFHKVGSEDDDFVDVPSPVSFDEI